VHCAVAEVTAHDLDICTAENAGVATVTVGGEVDIANGAHLRAAGLSALDAATQELVIDLTGVTFMDSAGLGHLVVILRAARPTPVKLLVTHPAVLRLFHITGLMRAFDVQHVA